ncbi:MAG TPA: MXAN_5187 C-terminal domain-containing protein [Myxococcales bacterium]|nr:MXAN_5187 C-terminal domain-containing protein [Myxococcales bacterium]
MRARIWIFTAVVALALALNLARISLSIAQTGEDTMGARVAAASTALRGQLELLDARQAPRAVAMMPDLIEAVRGEDRQPAARPDERALRAAASVLSPEPDLFAVVTAQGAIVSRRARPVQTLEDPAQLPLSQTASGAMPTPTFATFDNAVYRFAAARVPGATAAAVVGTLVDDRFAAQLKSQVDADVTLLQGGKILASSLPQGDDRVRLTRWAAAPAAGYGVLQIRLPFVGTALSGKLPRGTARYAVRGALLPLDGGVHAALTVPASPYLAWLGRYQAFYLLGLALLVLFGFVWGLLARTPAPVVQHVIAPPPVEPEDGVVSPPRRAPRTPTLIGADIGEPRSEPARSRDVPWSAGDGPSGEHKMVEPPRPPPAAAETKAAPEPPAEALHEPSAEPGTWPPPQSEAGPSAEAAREPAAEPAEWERPAQDEVAAHDWQLPAGQVTNGLPADASETPSPVREILDPLAAPEPRAEPFPGDEPTLVEGVSAALIDKLRERDEEPAAEPAPEANVTMQDFSMPGAEEADPDELHWRETYDRFRELKVQLGEPADRLSFEKFAAKLKKNRTDLLAKHNCKGVRFSVYEKDGRAAIKASAIR